MWSTLTRRSRPGSTGQPGRQVAPSSAAVTGSTVAPAGAGGALADDDAADGDGITAGDGVAAGGGSAEVHCTSATPAASISASTAPRRLNDVNWDESSPLASIPTRPLQSAVSLDKCGANATADRISCTGCGGGYSASDRRADRARRARGFGITSCPTPTAGRLGACAASATASWSQG